MRIQVTASYNGHAMYFQLRTSTGQTFRVRGDVWTRDVAAEARNLLAYEMGTERKNLRFCHK